MSTTPGTSRNTKVLVIEDDHNLRDMLEVVLELNDNIDVQTLGDERQALQVCKSYDPDVVVLDVRLPHLSGEKVAAQLRTERPDVQIISMSGFEPAERPWADAQVVKTVSFIEDLRRAIKRRTAQPDQRSEVG